MRPMQTSLTSLTAGISCALVLLASVGVAHGDEDVPLAKVPKPVLDAVKARFKEARLLEASKETEDGKVVYEVTLHDKGQHIDVTLTPEGELLLIEKTIAAKDLPKPVAAALEEKYPKSKHEIVEEIIKVEKKEEKLAYYEVLLTTAGKKKLEVQVSPNGKILNVEDKGASKEDK